MLNAVTRNFGVQIYKIILYIQQKPYKIFEHQPFPIS